MLTISSATTAFASESLNVSKTWIVLTTRSALLLLLVKPSALMLATESFAGATRSAPPEITVPCAAANLDTEVFRTTTK